MIQLVFFLLIFCSPMSGRVHKNAYRYSPDISIIEVLFYIARQLCLNNL